MLLSAGDHFNLFSWQLPPNIKLSLEDVYVKQPLVYVIQVNAHYVNSKHKLSIFRVNSDAGRSGVER
jgi:hypothetical protein